MLRYTINSQGCCAIALQPADIARSVRQVIEAPESIDTTDIAPHPAASDLSVSQIE